MVTTEAATVALIAASALHLGFQLTVTLVVYPALARAPDWERSHPAHTRAITPLVVVVYGLLAAAGTWALLSTWPAPWVLLSAAGAGCSTTSTALVAGPAHGRLARGRDERLLHRLLVADRVRTVGALVCCLGALGAVSR